MNRIFEIKGSDYAGKLLFSIASTSEQNVSSPEEHLAFLDSELDQIGSKFDKARICDAVATLLIRYAKQSKTADPVNVASAAKIYALTSYDAIEFSEDPNTPYFKNIDENLLLRMEEASTDRDGVGTNNVIISTKLEIAKRRLIELKHKATPKTHQNALKEFLTTFVFYHRFEQQPNDDFTAAQAALVDLQERNFSRDDRVALEQAGLLTYTLDLFASRFLFARICGLTSETDANAHVLAEELFPIISIEWINDEADLIWEMLNELAPALFGDESYSDVTIDQARELAIMTSEKLNDQMEQLGIEV